MDTLTRMRTFIQVVDAGGFTAAAKNAGRSKALISKYVSELEDELGTRLLNRTTRQLSTTEAGEHYYREARSILRRVDDLVEEVQDTSANPRGRLRVSLPRTMGDGAVGGALVDFARQYPDIELMVSMEDRMVNLVEEGFDVALRVATMADSSLIAKKLGSFRVISCAAPDIIAHYGKPLIPQDLTDKPCIIDGNNSPRNAWTYVQNGEKCSVTVIGRIEFNSPHAVRRAALAGLGFARIPRIFVIDDLARGTLIEVLDEFSDTERTIHIVYPHRRHLPVKTRAFVAFITDWFAANKTAMNLEGDQLR